MELASELNDRVVGAHFDYNKICERLNHIAKMRACSDPKTNENTTRAATIKDSATISRNNTECPTELLSTK